MKYEILSACLVEDFQILFMLQRHELTQHFKLARNYLESLLTFNVTYQTLVDSGKWLSMPPDDMSLMSLTAKVDQLQCLVQRNDPQGTQTKGKGKCFTCCKEDHWECNCPEKKQERVVKGKKNPPSWKKIAPKKNEPEEQMKNGQV